MLGVERATIEISRTETADGKTPKLKPAEAPWAARDVDQCSAYACPMRAYARPPRRTISTCRLPRNRSSPATSRRAHPAHACVRSVDKAPRKTPEKLGSSTRAPGRTRWSQRCAYAKERDEPDELVAGGPRKGPRRRFCPRRFAQVEPSRASVHMQGSHPCAHIRNPTWSEIEFADIRSSPNLARQL